MLGEEIKNRRLELKMTEKELVQKAIEYSGTDQNVFDEAQLIKWENNEEMIDIKNLWLLSKLLDYPILKFTNEQKKELNDIYYSYGLNIDENIELSDMETLAEKLSKYVTEKNLNDINQLLLETYIYKGLKIPKEIALLLSLSMMYKDEEKEEYLLYIQSYIKGLNKRIEIERIDKIVMERAEKRDLKYLAKLHNEVVRELEREKQDNIEKARKMYNKCRFSKKLKCIQITCDTLEQYYYIMGY